MSILSTADFLAAARFLRLLTMPYEKTAAFKEGVIDNKGTLLLPMKEMSQKQKESYTIFHRLVFNLRRLLQKVPIFGNNILLNYASALMLIREHVPAFRNNETLLIETLKEHLPSINENAFGDETSLEPIMIGREYFLNKDLLHEETFEPIYREGSKVQILHLSEKSIFDFPFYRAKHLGTNHTILVCESDVSSSPSVTPSVTTDSVGNADVPIIKKRKKSVRKRNEDL
jgi:hypothetical protein